MAVLKTLNIKATSIKSIIKGNRGKLKADNWKLSAFMI